MRRKSIHFKLMSLFLFIIAGLIILIDSWVFPTYFPCATIWTKILVDAIIALIAYIFQIIIDTKEFNSDVESANILINISNSINDTELINVWRKYKQDLGRLDWIFINGSDNPVQWPLYLILMRKNMFTEQQIKRLKELHELTEQEDKYHFIIKKRIDVTGNSCLIYRAKTK